MVFLKDVQFVDLKALVDYMYKGEVNVTQDQLAAFLSTAEALQIKGTLFHFHFVFKYRIPFVLKF